MSVLDPVSATIDRFVQAFNVNNLDAVVTFFAEDAVYQPGDGKTYRGPAEIREAFRPQFEYRYGRMRFDEHDRLIDVPGRKAAIRWVCRHDVAGVKPTSLAHAVEKFFVSLGIGRQFGWEGLDVFHFNGEGKITGKFTYANYWRPRIRRDLGTPLPPV